MAGVGGSVAATFFLRVADLSCAGPFDGVAHVLSEDAQVQLLDLRRDVGQEVGCLIGLVSCGM